MTPAPLERRPFGATGEHVSVLGFGAMELRNTPHRNPRPVANEIADELLNTALDLGIDFIDTSIDYGDSEDRIGRFIGHRRDEFLLATKAGCPVDHQPHSKDLRLEHDFSPANLAAGLDQSLHRLRTDRIDLLQLHVSPSISDMERDDVRATLEGFRTQGKVRFLGISSELPATADHLALGWVDALQVPYSALEPAMGPQLPSIGASGKAVIVRGGTAQGGSGGRAGSARSWADLALDDDVLDGDSVPGFLLRFVLASPEVSTVIVGTASVGHLRANVAAAERGPLDADRVELVGARITALSGTA